MHRPSFVTFLALWALVTSSSPLFAQNAGRQRYRPQKRTISPYLDYFRRDIGVLDPYNQFGRRDLRSRQDSIQQQLWMDQQQRRIDQQQRGLAHVQEGVRNVRTAIPMVKTSGITPTGKASTFQQIPAFQNLSHFYGWNSGISGRQ